MTNKLLTKNSTLVHEANYARLLYVIPEIQSIRSRALIRSQTKNHKIEINVLEKTKYTSALSITLIQHSSQRWLPNLCIVIRTYHDARIVEVINFQNHCQIRSKYNYPNAKMYHKNEKQQINHFFGEWLSYCIKSRCIFDNYIEPIGV